MANLNFHVRGDKADFNAYSSVGPAEGRAASGDSSGTTSHASQAGAYGSGNNVFRLSANWAWFTWIGYRNAKPAVKGHTAIIRIVPRFNGFPAGDTCLLAVGADSYLSGLGAFELMWLTTGYFRLRIADPLGIADKFLSSASPYTAVSGTAVEIGHTSTGDTTSNGLKLYVDRALSAQTTLSRVGVLVENNVIISGQKIGGGAPYGNFDINEILYFDNVDTAVTDARSTFYTSSARDGGNNTWPAASKVSTEESAWMQYGVSTSPTLSPPSAGSLKHGVTHQGVTGTYQGDDYNDALVADDLKVGITRLNRGSNVTGTYAGDDRNDAIVASELAIGVSKLNRNATVTGTYYAAERWTAIPENKVETGYAFKQNSTTNNKTGSLETVTNLIDGGVLSAPVQSGTLREA